MNFTDPKGRTLTVNSPDGSVPTEQELDQMFAQKYANKAPASVSSQGLGYLQQHPVLSAIQPALKTLTGQSAQDMAQQASQIPIPQATQRPFDSNVQMAGSPIGNAIRTGVPAIAGTLGGAVDAMTTPINYAIPPLLKGAGKLIPTAYNDALVSGTTKSMINKIQSQLQPIRDAYKGIMEPFKNTITDSDTFQKALSVVPKSIRQDFIDAYGTGVVDVSGKPMTTIGNLHKMELEMKDFINQPQFGGKINAAEFNVAEAAKKLKDIRLSQLPDSSSDAIRSLDKKFGPVITASNELLPKLADKNGVVNTGFLKNTFSDYGKAGMRDYMRNLKDIGIDINPEINTIRGWVARQGEKKFIKSALDKVPGLSVLGYGMHH